MRVEPVQAASSAHCARVLQERVLPDLVALSYSRFIEDVPPGWCAVGSRGVQEYKFMQLHVQTCCTHAAVNCLAKRAYLVPSTIPDALK